MSIFGGSSFVGGGGGGAQGVIRYQVLVDSQQATQQVNNFKNSLTSVGSPVANATKNITSFNTVVKQTATGIPPINQNLNQFNATMKQTTTQFSAGVTPIKQTGDAMANYQKNIAATGTAQKGIGTQVKDMASKYSTFAIGMGSTVSQVVSLSRQYRDLVDTQIAVDRTARKMSLAQEAVDKTTAKLNALQAKGVTSGAEYNNALRDQQQALAQLKIATDVHDEALEAQGDTYMNFATQVIPTAITAVGTLGSAFKDLGLKSSTFTGLLGKMKTGAGGIIGIVTNLATQLFGVGTAGTAAGVGTTAAAGGIKAVDASSKTAAFSVSTLGKALGLIAIPLAGLTFFLELKAVNEELEKRLNKTSTSIIDSSKKADKGYSDFMKNMRDETKQTHEVMSEKVPFVKELGDAVAFVTGQFPGLNEWIVKTSGAMDDAVVSGDMQHRSLTEIALGINKVTVAGKTNLNQMSDISKAQDNLTAAQKNYDDMLGFGTQAQVAAAKALLDKAKADLAAAKAQGASTEQLKDYGKTISVLNPATGKYTETIEKVGSQHLILNEVIKASLGNITSFDTHFSAMNSAIAKGYQGILDANPVYKAFGNTQESLGKQFGDLRPKIVQNYGTMLGLGDTVENLKIKYQNFGKVQQDIHFPNTEAQAAVNGLDAWGSQTVDTTEKTNALIAADKLMTDTMKADQAVVSARTKTYMDLVTQLGATYDTTGKNMSQLQGYAAQQESINKQIAGFQQDQEVGYKEVEASILGVAYAHNVNTEAMKDMVQNGENNVTQLRNMVAEAIDYTAALTDMATNQELISEGFLNGITAAEDFFNNLVKGTEQTAQFNAAVADGAEELGLTSEMLSFTSGKAQELIQTTYESVTGLTKHNTALAMNTKFLHDNFLIMSQRQKGTLEGIQSANDWTASMIKETAATKSQHDQTVVLAKQMGIMNDLTGKSTDEIQLMMKAADGDADSIKALADAAKAAAADFTSLADAANQRFQTVLKIKIPDADKELKKMIKDLPKDVRKDVNLELKFAGKASVANKNFQDFLKVAMTMPEGDAEAMAKKIIADLDKGFGKGKSGEKAFPGLKAQLEAAIASGDTPAALYKIIKDYPWGGVGVKLPESIQKDLDGVILNPAIEADTNTGSQLSKDIQAQMQSNPFKVDPLTLFNLGQIDIAKILGLGDEQTQEVKITADNTEAIKKVDQVAQRIIDLGNYKPQISLQNRNAFSSIETTANEIDKLTKIKPQISLQNKNAFSSIQTVEKEIDNLTKIKPQISLQNRNAISAIQTVEGEIKKLSNIKPTITVKVKYDTSDKPPGTEKVSGGEVIGAERVSERTDIMGAESKGFVHARGTEGLQVNLYNYNNDRETLRTFKRELGRQRYTMGI